MGMGGRPSGWRWTKFTQLVLATYGDTCHLCGHGGARQADHLIPVCDAPELAWELANVRPAHGGWRNKCATCGRACNQVRGARSIIYARKAVRRPRYDTESVEPPVQEPGREW